MRLSRSKTLIWAVLCWSCRDAGSEVIPETTLGGVAKGWLFAHNQGDGHAMVHYTLGNRGSVRMTGSQVDSTVYDGVRFAREVGPLEPVRLLESSDSSITILLRSRAGDSWRARFTPAAQPSAVRVKVEVGREGAAPDSAAPR